MELETHYEDTDVKGGTPDDKTRNTYAIFEAEMRAAYLAFFEDAYPHEDFCKIHDHVSTEPFSQLAEDRMKVFRGETPSFLTSSL